LSRAQPYQVHGQNRWQGATLACALRICRLKSSLAAAETAAAKRVLIPFREGKALPVNLAVALALETALRSPGTNRMGYRAEYLAVQSTHYDLTAKGGDTAQIRPTSDKRLAL